MKFTLGSYEHKTPKFLEHLDNRRPFASDFWRWTGYGLITVFVLRVILYASLWLHDHVYCSSVTCGPRPAGRGFLHVMWNGRWMALTVLAVGAVLAMASAGVPYLIKLLRRRGERRLKRQLDQAAEEARST